MLPPPRLARRKYKPLAFSSDSGGSGDNAKPYRGDRTHIRLIFLFLKAITSLAHEPRVVTTQEQKYEYLIARDAARTAGPLRGVRASGSTAPAIGVSRPPPALRARAPGPFRSRTARTDRPLYLH